MEGPKRTKEEVYAQLDRQVRACWIWISWPSR